MKESRKLRRLRLFIHRAVVMVTLLPLVAVMAWGQLGNSSISGFVYDASQAVIPGASVTLNNPATGFTRETQSDQAGYYKFTALQPGTYELRVRADGFQTYVATNIVLQVAQVLNHGPILQVGATVEEITVEASGVQLLESESAVVGQVIAERQIVELPLDGRNFLQLASLGSGAHPTVLQGSRSSFASNVTNRPNTTVNLGGQRESATSFLLDGIEMRNDRTGNLAMQPSIDAIAEFKVQRGWFPAENGFHPGIVNVNTKGGTNDFHGAVWEFLRNNELDARNFFSPGVEPFQQNQFGAVVSGPIVRDKLLFMYDYEGFRQRLGTVLNGIYPTQRQFSGDLSESFNNPVFDPLTFDSASGSRDPFPNNIIPSDRINRFSNDAVNSPLALFPVVTAPPTGINRIINPKRIQDDNQHIGRLDMPNLSMFGAVTQLAFRIGWADSEQDSPGLAPFQTLQRPIFGRNVMLQLTNTLSPRTIHVLRLGFQRDRSPFIWEGAGGTVNISRELGLKNTTDNPIDFAAPGFGLAGFSGTGGGFNLQTITNRYILADNITHITGGHTIKAGFELRYVRLMQETSTFANGSLAFSGQFTSQTLDGGASLVPNTGSSVADFLLGFPTSGSAAFGDPLVHFRFTQAGFYAQDDWKVTPDFTLHWVCVMSLRRFPSRKEGTSTCSTSTRVKPYSHRLARCLPE